MHAYSSLPLPTRTRTPPKLTTTPHKLRARPHTPILRGPRTRRTAPPSPPPRSLGIARRQPASASENVEDVCQADHTAESTTDVGAGDLRSRDRGSNIRERSHRCLCLAACARPRGRGDVRIGVLHAERILGVVCRARARRDAGRGRRGWGLGDPHAVGAGGDEFGDGVGEGAVGADVEDWVGVFAVLDAALGEDDGDEVDAGGGEEGDG